MKISNPPVRIWISVNMKNWAGASYQTAAVSIKSTLKYDRKLTEKGDPRNGIDPVVQADSMAEAVSLVSDYLRAKGYVSTW